MFETVMLTNIGPKINNIEWTYMILETKNDLQYNTSYNIHRSSKNCEENDLRHNTKALSLSKQEGPS